MNIKKYIVILLALAILMSAAVLPISAAGFITTVEVTLAAPVTGSVVRKSADFPDNPDYEVTNVMWKDCNDGSILSEGDTFKAGHVYMAGIMLVSLRGKDFDEERTTVALNGGATEWEVPGSTMSKGSEAIIYHTFPKTTVEHANNLPFSGVDVPVADEAPDWEISCDWDGADIIAMGWQCVETKDTVFSYSNQSVKDKFRFKAGYTYKMAVEVEIRNGYELYEFFSASVNGQFANGIWTLTGKKAVVEFTFPVVPTPDSTPGDVNSDTNINLSDVSLMLKHIAGWDVEIDVDAADVNNDSAINLTDASAVLKYIAGWDVELK